MSTKTWVINTVLTHAEQRVNIQPTPEFDGIEFWFEEENKTAPSGILYIKKDELPVIFERMQSMMDYVTKQKNG